MARTKEIKKRIASVKNTQQITNAMKMVAAAKLRRAQEAIVRARPYGNMTLELLQGLAQRARVERHPLLESKTDPQSVALVVVTSDKGLCGGFNANILRHMESYLHEHQQQNVQVIAVGKKARDYARKHHLNVTAEYVELFNEMDFSITRKIILHLIELFTNGKVDKIDIIYNEFQSAIQQNLRVQQLLPIEAPEPEESAAPLGDYIYEPSFEALATEVITNHLDVILWRVLLESSAAEQGARMTAMDSATENAIELVRELTLNFNRARQAAITTEITEISSGAEAISN